MMNKKKLLSILIFCCIVYNLYLSINNSNTEFEKDIPLIFLNAKYSTFFYWDNNPNFCPHKCIVTNNKRDFDKSKIVIFNIVHQGKISPPEKKINKDQIWIVNTYFEPPNLKKKSLIAKKLNGKIDYIYSYRKDADFIEKRISYLKN